MSSTENHAWYTVKVFAIVLFNMQKSLLRANVDWKNLIQEGKS